MCNIIMYKSELHVICICLYFALSPRYYSSLERQPWQSQSWLDNEWNVNGIPFLYYHGGPSMPGAVLCCAGVGSCRSPTLDSVCIIL